MWVVSRGSTLKIGNKNPLSSETFTANMMPEKLISASGEEVIDPKIAAWS